VQFLISSFILHATFFIHFRFVFAHDFWSFVSERKKMPILRHCNTLLKLCNHSLRTRSSCWRSAVAARLEFVRCEAPAIRRVFSSSSQPTQNSEDALDEEISEMRSRMKELHHIASDKGVSLRDYKRISSEDDETDVSDSAFSEDSSETDLFEDSSSQIRSLDETTRKGLRKRKGIDVLVYMPYGNVRFDTMNKHQSTAQSVNGRSDDVQENVPSVKITKDGRHVFSVNAVLENENKLEHALEDIAKEETCQVTSQSETESYDVKPNVFEEQYFENLQQQEDEKQQDLVKGIAADCKTYDPKSDVFQQHCFGEERKQVTGRKILKRDVRRHKTCDVTLNVFDGQYFGDELQQEEKPQRIKSTRTDHAGETKQEKSVDTENANAASIEDEELSHIDEQYFGSYTQRKIAQDNDTSKGVSCSSEQMSHYRQDRHQLLAPDSNNRFQQRSTNLTLSKSTDYDHVSAPVWKEVEDILKDSITDYDSPIVVEPITRREMKYRTKPHADVENPKTAYDLAVKIRREQQQKQGSDKSQKADGMNLNTNTASA